MTTKTYKLILIALVFFALVSSIIYYIFFAYHRLDKSKIEFEIPENRIVSYDYKLQDIPKSSGETNWENSSGTFQHESEYYTGNFVYETNDWKTNIEAAKHELGVFTKIDYENDKDEDWGLTRSNISDELHPATISRLAPTNLIWRSELDYVDLYTNLDYVLEMIGDASEQNIKKKGIFAKEIEYMIPHYNELEFLDAITINKNKSKIFNGLEGYQISDVSEREPKVIVKLIIEDKVLKSITITWNTIELANSMTSGSITIDVAETQDDFEFPKAVITIEDNINAEIERLDRFKYFSENPPVVNYELIINFTVDDTENKYWKAIMHIQNEVFNQYGYKVSGSSRDGLYTQVIKVSDNKEETYEDIIKIIQDNLEPLNFELQSHSFKEV